MGLLQRNVGTYYEVREPVTGRLRHETVSLHDAEAVATGIYRNETQTICEITEVVRLPPRGTS